MARDRLLNGLQNYIEDKVNRYKALSDPIIVRLSKWKRATIYFYVFEKGIIILRTDFDRTLQDNLLKLTYILYLKQTNKIWVILKLTFIFILLQAIL